MTTKTLLAATGIALSIAVPVTAGGAAQIELDRIVSRAAGRIITQSDIRQAQALRLVDDPSSEAAVRRALETRLLILGELERAAAFPPPSAAEVAARRAEWTASVGGQDQAAGLLARHGMTDGELESWLADDLRIHAYLGRQFGMLSDGERGRAVDEWISRLRQRADLR